MILIDAVIILNASAKLFLNLVLTMKATLITLVCLLIITACEQPPADSSAEPASEDAVQSLSGTALVPPLMSEERRQALMANYEKALANYVADPMDADNIIWLGRRAGYLWNYVEAVDRFTEGIEKHPEDPRMYRHRGHRHITLRQFEQAESDLRKASELMVRNPDEIEPDGAPNAAGIPTSTLYTNVWYHLGLAHYLQGEFGEALAAYQNCLEASTNNDMAVATIDWYYMTLQRLGRADEAAALIDTLDTGMDLLENHSYLRRIQMYKGELPPDSLMSPPDSEDYSLTLATQGYGVGNWHLYNGDALQARAVFEDILSNEYWAAFGYIAAEAELYRGIE